MYADSRAWIAAAQLDPPDLSDRESAGALLAASTVAYFSVQDARLAIRYADQGLRFARQAGDPTLEARLLLAASSPRADDHWIERLEQAVHIGNELDDPPLRRLTLHRLGEARRDHGCLDAARTLLEESLQISRRLADGFGANTEHSLGDLELDAGNYAEALRRYAAAMIEWPPTRRTQIYCVAGIAAALAASGSPDPAITLWNRAEQEEQRSGARMLDIERPRYETHVTHAARTVSPETTSHAQHQASAMSWDDALETALSYVA
jgi:tetratricopeptide (TPR) repeat protein